MKAARASEAVQTERGQGARAVRHVAIIMDGNGRWAKKRMLPRIAGHKKGVEAARATVRAAGELGIEVITLYAFSSENWRRPEAEVSDLMGLLRVFIRTDIDELANNGVRLRVIGDYRALAPDLVKMIDGAIARTAHNERTTLVIALNYGSQNEIVRAARALAERAKAGDLDPAAIDEAAIAGLLDTEGLPELDLLIRTSGEKRLSNFLLWQSAYAEMMFVDTLWPDFGKADLAAALDQFAQRERRFGGL
ncbi:isoprenyl transferase [Sphingobium boeckii]|uniref:Isoprenyl transferase n=1 Tax=Sphingobium boeckii TaxID=1082345 RepID=A0A7W9AKU5_9SPHN|nr:undecaprenyl diphosphate synthase [Sphingobium boeckii]